MKKLNEAISLLTTSKKVKNHIATFTEDTSKSNVDKYGNVFKQGNSDRFVSQPLPMYLECYTGYYGSSNCSTKRLSSIPDEVSKAYVQWANKNMQLILDGISEELKEKGLSLKKEVEDELNDAQEAYKQAFN